MVRAIRILALLGVGLALGVATGLYFGWQVWPTEFTDAGVGLLDETYQWEYALMVAQTYAVEGDLARAEARLSQLDSADPRGRMRAIAVDMILAGEPTADLQIMVSLAADLGVTSPAMAPYLPVDENSERNDG